MTSETVDLTAARVLAVAARDAAKRLRDECKRLIDLTAVLDDERFGREDRCRVNTLAEQSQYLIGECNDAVGSWTRAADLYPLPTPKGDDEGGDGTCGDSLCDLPQCVARRTASAECGEGVRSGDAPAAFADLVKQLEAQFGCPVRLLKL